MSLSELIPPALIGTRTANARLPAAPPELAGVLPGTTVDAAENWLAAAAALTLFERAGRLPAGGIEAPVPCPDDSWSECSGRAGEILSEALEAALQPVIMEWLRMATAARRRVPHALLPKLLDAAANRRALQAAVPAVLDRRGHWLTQFNPRWQFARAVDQSAEETWQLGNRQQRSEVLREVRSSDPAKAREWLAATWPHDGAEERADWLRALQVNLSSDDEDFLESALDDRSGRVRESAASLLSQLPSSKFVARMGERLDPLILLRAGSKGSLLKLKRGTKPHLEVTLPDGFDKTMQRDGIAEKPPQGQGPKQWWLEQMIGYTPLDHWTERFGASAAELIAGVPEEYMQALLRGWLAALGRRPVLEWIQPLTVAAASQMALQRSVLNAIPFEQRVAFLQQLAASGKRPPNELPELFDAWSPLSPEVSQFVLNGYGLDSLLSCEGYLHLHPAVFGPLEAEIATEAQAARYGKLADRVLSVIVLRRDLHKELAT